MVTRRRSARFREISPYPYSRPYANSHALQPQKTTREKRRLPTVTLKSLITVFIVFGVAFYAWYVWAGETPVVQCAVCGKEVKSYFEVSVHGHRDFDTGYVALDTTIAAVSGNLKPTVKRNICEECYGKYMEFFIRG